MDKLQNISPSTSAVKLCTEITPKRTYVPQLPLTPLQAIKEESEKQKEQKCSPISRNPFDMKAEALYFPACSPSVFATFQRNKVNDGTFRWSIDQLSVLYPADIDETSLPEPWVDADHEVKAQKAIDTFFSQSSIVPSPWSSSPKEGKSTFRSRRRACMKGAFSDVQKNEATTQTLLSIPPNIDLKAILGDFFTFDDKEEANSRENSREEADLLSTSSLRRKLFANEEECVSPSRNENSFQSAKRWSTPTVHMHSAQSTPASDVLSSSPITPPNCSDSCNILASPPVSPITSTGTRARVSIESFADKREVKNVCRSPVDKGYPYSLPASQDSVMSFCIESQEMVPFQSYTSERQDTGYATGSISSSQNITSSELNYGPISRITPVLELMEECELSNSATCDMSYKTDCESIGDISSIDHQTGLNKCNIKGHSWLPTCCSTPTQCFHS